MRKWRDVRYPISYVFKDMNNVSFESKLTNPDNDKLMIDNAENFIKDLIDYGMDMQILSIFQLVNNPLMMKHWKKKK